MDYFWRSYKNFAVIYSPNEVLYDCYYNMTQLIEKHEFNTSLILEYKDSESDKGLEVLKEYIGGDKIVIVNLLDETNTVNLIKYLNTESYACSLLSFFVPSNFENTNDIRAGLEIYYNSEFLHVNVNNDAEFVAAYNNGVGEITLDDNQLYMYY